MFRTVILWCPNELYCLQTLQFLPVSQRVVWGGQIFIEVKELDFLKNLLLK